MHHIMIVEDHPEMREWIAGVANDAFPTAETLCVGTLNQARRWITERNFDLILIDIGLPDGSGVDLVAEIEGQSQSTTYTVVTTIYDDDLHLFAALEAGAKGYLLKDQPRERLVEQLRGILRGEPPISPSIARRILRFFSHTGLNAMPEGAGLTERERETLSLIARGFNRNDISTALGITPNTAASYIKSIYRKLNVSGRAEAALKAVELGIVGRAP